MTVTFAVTAGLPLALNEALSVTGVLVVTVLVVTVNDVSVAPAGVVMVAGTVTAGLLERVVNSIPAIRTLVKNVQASGWRFLK